MVTLTTNRGERLDPGAVVHAGERTLTVVSSRLHQGRHLVRFDAVDDRTAAEALRGVVLSADALGAAPDGELWVHELIGATVVDRSGRERGTVVAVEANPAHDLLVLEGGGLVPMVFVIDERDGRVVIDPPAGLLDDDPEST